MTLSTIALTFAEANRYFNEQLSAHFYALDSGDWYPLILIFSLAFAYGVLHALGPGHGKALVAGYLLANPTKRSHVFQIGFLIAIVHALSALSVTLVATYFVKISTTRLFRDVNPPLFQVSGALMALLGCWLLLEVWRSRHITTETISANKSRFSVVFLAGIVPCPGVITLSFFSITLGHVGVGIIAVFFMSLGMGLSISIAGLIAHVLQSSHKIMTQPKWFWVLRILGALCVFVLGLWFLSNPLPKRVF